MSDTTLTRRDALASALAAGAFYLLPDVARATTPVEGPAEAFSFELLKEKARLLSRQDFKPARIAEAETLDKLDYDRHNQIRFKPDRSLWKGQAGRSPVQFFFPGRYFKESIKVYSVEGGMAREVLFSKGLFDIPEDNPAKSLKDSVGFAGFRVQDETSGLDWMAFLGASYWRTSGYSGQFGLSVRGLALDTAVATGPEEFPRFTRFWLEPQKNGGLVAYALLESPRATGAYRISSSRDKGVIQDIDATLFLRGDVERLGIAPLTSMFWYGKQNRNLAPDWRPEVHDSDGLEIHDSEGRRTWRPLNNPPRTMANAFMADNLRGFGLMQRERSFQEYLDDGVFYEKRASAWIEPKGNWGNGAVSLVEIPTDDEIHDNIVAFWTPGPRAAAGSRYDLAYRLHWAESCPVTPDTACFTATRIGAGGVPGQPRPAGVAKMVCDFDPHGFDGLGRGDAVLHVSASQGLVDNTSVYPVAGEDYWRAIFDIDFSALPENNDDPIDIAAYVEVRGKAMTETLLLQLFPSQLRRIVGTRA
ncbi:glucan biosynthesis protein [Albibacillus kandeliae]|uniref:glucan biosynthesis protein n=1 Tax=Albibacillus kandeliae TaxID=2174228 RepID=UPI000D687AF5|nr:glucan biosynthesis protein D [Albibacillus kandeliae]